MEGLIIREKASDDSIPWDLLLLADPARDAIQKYIDEGEVYLAQKEDRIIGVYVLVRISQDAVELKNIAVDKKYQKQGVGKKLVLDAIGKAKSLHAKKIEVGTGNSSLSQLALYQKCGFEITGIDKGFFTRNYSKEIVENGIKCVDMIKLSLNLAC